MKKIILYVLAILITIGATVSIIIYYQLSNIRVEKVTDNIDVIFGLGGNVGVFKTKDGLVIVDTLTRPMQGKIIKNTVIKLYDLPVSYIINTHYHIDHTQGNPGFSKETPVIATEKTRKYMTTTDSWYWEGGNEDYLPDKIFNEQYILKISGKTVQVKHLGSGHTGGDAVILFVEDKVLHAGDLLFHKFYPNIPPAFHFPVFQAA